LDLGACLSEVHARVCDVHEAGHVVLGRAKEAGCVGISRAAASVGRYCGAARRGDGGGGGDCIGGGGGTVGGVGNDEENHSGDGEDEGHDDEDEDGGKDPLARGILVAVALTLGAGEGCGDGGCLGEGFLWVVEVLVGRHRGGVVGEHFELGSPEDSVLLMMVRYDMVCLDVKFRRYLRRWILESMMESMMLLWMFGDGRKHQRLAKTRYLYILIRRQPPSMTVTTTLPVTTVTMQMLPQRGIGCMPWSLVVTKRICAWIADINAGLDEEVMTTLSEEPWLRKYMLLFSVCGIQCLPPL
jgi:hypothetical protein